MTVPPPETPKDILTRVKKDIAFDRNLKGIYKDLRQIPDNTTSKILVLLSYSLSSIYVILVNPSKSESKDFVISLTSNGMNYAITMLGFVLAGFTIFLSVSNRDFFIELATLKHTKLRMNYLKYTIYLFYNVFLLFGILYFSFLIINATLNDSASVKILKTLLTPNYIWTVVFLLGYCTSMIALSASYLTSSLVNIGRLVMRSIANEIEEADVLGYPKD